jgi:ATP-dependent Lhr-like helicase
MLKEEHLQRTENGGLIIGRAGEAVVNHFHFYTVFIIPEYFLVKEENNSIGTVDKIFPPGVRFSLAGITWETIDVNAKSKIIFVKRVPGISVVDWDVDFEAELHPVLVKKMREIMLSNEAYVYLSESSVNRLNEIRFIARNSGILTNLVTSMSTGLPASMKTPPKNVQSTYAIFPWVGTRQLFVLHYALLKHGVKSRILWRTCVYLEVHFNGSEGELEDIIDGIIASDLDTHALPLPENAQIAYKYNEFIPQELLRKQFVEDFLDFEGLRKWIERK